MTKTKKSNIGLDHAQLEAIELRLIGADHRPWGVYPDNSAVGTFSRKLREKAVRHAIDPRSDPEKPMANLTVMESELSLFKAGDRTTPEMLEFVANAPDDIELLLREARMQASRANDLAVERDKLIAELRAVRAELKAASDKLGEIRAAWARWQRAIGSEA